MLPIEEIRRRLYLVNMETVARETGLHYNTVRYCRDGTRKSPTYHTCLKISEWLVANNIGEEA